MALFLTRRQVWWCWQITRAAKYNVAGVPRSEKTRDRNRLSGLEPGSLCTEGESHDPNREDIRSFIACFGFEGLPRSEAPCLSPLWRRRRNTRSVNHKRRE